MKSNLNCLVSRCSYNQGGYCYASHIMVNGPDATNANETNCDTYIENYSKSVTALTDMNITNTQNISCLAKNCTYNICGGCSATHVLISRESSKCDTFRVKN